MGSDGNLKNPVPCYSFVIIAYGLWAGHERRNGDPTNAHRLVRTPRRGNHSGVIWAVAQDQLQALKYPLKHIATLFEGPLPMEPSGHRD